MIDNASIRPVPRWVHIWAIVSFIAMGILLVLGGMVTTLRAGMADPDWPTVPWYLFYADWKTLGDHFLVEHLHRLAGFTVGGLVSLLTLFIWWSEPWKTLRWIGVVSVIGLIGVFGMFHGQMMKQIESPIITWPMPTIYALLANSGFLLLLGLTRWIGGANQGGLRFISAVVLIAVMIQGLLGGLRVRLNDLFGTDLAAIHGIFGQVTFCLLLTITILTAAPRTTQVLPSERRGLMLWSIHALSFVLLQLIWGAWIRHQPSPLPQRLHFLTAFLVVTVVVIYFIAARNSQSWLQVRGVSLLLVGLLVFQVLLGVEAWLGKFLAVELPDAVQPKPSAVAIRSLHMMTGACIFATATALVIRIGIRKPEATYPIESPTQVAQEKVHSGILNGSRAIDAPESVGGTI